MPSTSNFYLFLTIKSISVLFIRYRIDSSYSFWLSFDFMIGLFSKDKGLQETWGPTLFERFLLMQLLGFASTLGLRLESTIAKYLQFQKGSSVWLGAFCQSRRLRTQNPLKRDVVLRVSDSSIHIPCLTSRKQPRKIHCTLTGECGSSLNPSFHNLHQSYSASVHVLIGPCPNFWSSWHSPNRLPS